MDAAVLQAAIIRLNPALHGLRDEPAVVRQQRIEVMNSMESSRQQFLSGNITEGEFFARNSELMATLRTLNAHLPPPAPPPWPRPWPGRVQWPGPAPRPSSSDEFGYGPWRKTHDRRGAFTLFRGETDLRTFDVGPGWHFLPQEQKEAYRSRAEASRRAAWAEFETVLASTPPATRLENYLWSKTLTKRGLQLRKSLRFIVTGFELFRDDQLQLQDAPDAAAGSGLGLAYQEAVARWEALSEEQRKAYDERAWAMHKEACDALPEDYLENLCRERGEPGPWDG